MIAGTQQWHDYFKTICTGYALKNKSLCHIIQQQVIYNQNTKNVQYSSQGLKLQQPI